MSSELLNSGPLDLLFFPDIKTVECFQESFNFATRGQYYHVS